MAKQVNVIPPNLIARVLYPRTIKFEPIMPLTPELLAKCSREAKPALAQAGKPVPPGIIKAIKEESPVLK